MSLLLLFNQPSGSGTYTLACSAGAYVISGKSATLVRARSLTCAAGAYAITGNAATLVRARSLVCSAGAYAINGNAATLTYVPSINKYVLTCNSGAYTIAGTNATFTYVSKTQTNSGGYFPGYVKRKRSVDEDRQELGIIPKEVKKIIKEVVKENLGYDSKARAAEALKIELQRRDIAYKQNYAAALEAYRDHMVSLEIYRLMKIKQDADDQDDEEAAIMLLM